MQTKLTFLPEDSPASHTASPENEKGKKMNATCGPKCLEQLEKFNHVGLWAKTFSALLIGMEGWYSMRCKLTWKLRGTKYGRMYFQLAPSTLPTDEIGFGLLPTPAAQEGFNSGTGEPYVTGTGTVRMKNKDGSSSRLGLEGVMKSGLLPTPTASSDPKGGCTRKDSNRQNDTLAHAMHAYTNGQPGTSSQLSHQFVLEMMGFPTNYLDI